MWRKKWGQDLGMVLQVSKWMRIKRYYTAMSLAPRYWDLVVGGDKQGIIGLEVWYDDILKGMDGKNTHYHGC